MFKKVHLKIETEKFPSSMPYVSKLVKSLLSLPLKCEKEMNVQLDYVEKYPYDVGVFYSRKTSTLDKLWGFK